MDQLFVNAPAGGHAPPHPPQPVPAYPPAPCDPPAEHDDYDDDFAELPSSPKKEKQIRRRSSKACDQCRKSKCKCERPGPPEEPCRNCVLLGTPCTFLGPSRKRGPPKGYIDAIETRLHQMEAILGTLLAADDPRARSIIHDLAGDPLARRILDRVDNSPYGTRGKAAAALADRNTRITRIIPPSPAVGIHPFTTATSEWQDHLTQRLRAGTDTRGPQLSLVTDVRAQPDAAAGTSAIERDPSGASPRQRRRLGSFSSPHNPHSISTPSACASSEDEEELADAVGQLSVNEESQVRYHGKASGLHILGQSDRLDSRNEGGLWRFPRAGVWPRASRSAACAHDEAAAEWEARASFPTPHLQEGLLRLYFAYVHPVLPVMQEARFWRRFYGEPDPDAKVCAAGEDAAPRPEVHGVDTLLLISMFAVAARYGPTTDVPLPMSEGDMWSAGDQYLEHAKRMLNNTYALSRPSTCQALLLLSYREIGIGAMAQAWLYVGMAVRMAQDLGMHRSAEKWQRTGAEVFTETERQVRNRIWYSCVIMDKYVSTYIGRPLSIFERDFDTPYPAEDPAEELVLWTRHSWPCPVDEDVEQTSSFVPVPVHLMSCFNASARLSSILSNIVETVYAVHPPAAYSRHTASALIDKRLDMWYLGLPEHLQLNCTTRVVPPPHVFTLHMQYWCSVLLVHRPFMRRKPHGGGTQEEDPDTDATCRKAFDLCAMAATKITNLVSKYNENFYLQRSPAFLTYYVFSAGIMHMTTLSMRSIDVQAGVGLQRCMLALRKMKIIWPSAGRAWELLHGAKITMHGYELQVQRRLGGHDKRKRAPDDRAEEPEPDPPLHAMQQQRFGFEMAPPPPPPPQLQAGQPYMFGVGADGPLVAGWPQEGYAYAAPAPALAWKGVPGQFGDASQLTSELCGLPLLVARPGDAPAFMPVGAEFQLYNSVQPASSSNSQ